MAAAGARIPSSGSLTVAGRAQAGITQPSARVVYMIRKRDGFPKMTNFLRSLLLVVTLVLTTNCYRQGDDKYRYEVNSYRSVIGFSESDLQKTFGQSRLKLAALLMHDWYENGLRLSIEKESIFLRMRNDIVSSVLFDSPSFRTNRGTRVGQQYCGVLSVYPEAEFAFGSAYGGFLRLLDNERGMVFEFSTGNIPWNKYAARKPGKGTSLLCSEILISIELRGLIRPR